MRNSMPHEQRRTAMKFASCLAQTTKLSAPYRTHCSCCFRTRWRTSSKSSRLHRSSPRRSPRRSAPHRKVITRRSGGACNIWRCRGLTSAVASCGRRTSSSGSKWQRQTSGGNTRHVFLRRLARLRCRCQCRSNGAAAALLSRSEAGPTPRSHRSLCTRDAMQKASSGPRRQCPLCQVFARRRQLVQLGRTAWRPQRFLCCQDLAGAPAATAPRSSARRLDFACVWTCMMPTYSSRSGLQAYRQVRASADRRASVRRNRCGPHTRTVSNIQLRFLLGTSPQTARVRNAWRDS
mmetsp:Transcript_14935/g.40977  ORF Transcript_14935/g.40977 Transcript_14935/m.40977 type:complete len:292 (-) Transcript_14935:579-1454(-)